MTTCLIWNPSYARCYLQRRPTDPPEIYLSRPIDLGLSTFGNTGVQHLILCDVFQSYLQHLVKKVNLSHVTLQVLRSILQSGAAQRRF